MNLSLRQKLAVLAFVVLVPLTGVIVYQLVHLSAVLAEATVERAEDEAEFAALALDDYVMHLAEQGEAVGHAFLIGGLEGERAQAYIDAVATGNPELDFAVFETNGTPLASSSPSLTVGARAVWEETERFADEDVVVTSTTGNERTRMLLVLEPVRDDSRVELVVAIRSTRRGVGEVLPEPSIPGAILVTDDEGRVMYAAAEIPALGRDDVAMELPTVADAVEGRRSVRRSVAIPGFPRPFVGAQVPAEDLTVGFYTPAGQALAHVRREAILTGAVVLAVLLVSALTSRIYGTRIVAVIERLTQATHRVAQGDFHADVPIETRDEIGRLAQDFSRMQGALRLAFADEATLSEAAAKLNEATTVPAVARAGAEYLARLLLSPKVALTVLGAEAEPTVFGVPDNDDSVLALAQQAQDVVGSEELFGRWGVISLQIDGRIERVLSIPLRQAGALIGRVDAALRRERPSETERTEFELASSLAQQTATALANVILFERERLIADTLQDSLLTAPPRVSPMLIGLQYRPATRGMRIGGDFYDFLQVSGGRVAVIVGDISGKGLSAARQTALAKGAIRSFALDDPQPHRVLERANRTLFQQFETGAFVTAFYALVDFEREILEYATAGHPPPMLLRHEQTLESLAPSGPPLGVLEEADYPCHTLQFCRDDSLVIYSDGLSEARAPDGGLFGEELVAVAVMENRRADPEGLARCVVAAAETYTGGSFADDLTVVVIRFGQTD